MDGSTFPSLRPREARSRSRRLPPSLEGPRPSHPLRRPFLLPRSLGTRVTFPFRRRLDPLASGAGLALLPHLSHLRTSPRMTLRRRSKRFTRSQSPRSRMKIWTSRWLTSREEMKRSNPRRRSSPLRPPRGPRPERRMLPNDGPSSLAWTPRLQSRLHRPRLPHSLLLRPLPPSARRLTLDDRPPPTRSPLPHWSNPSSQMRCSTSRVDLSVN